MPEVSYLKNSQLLANGHLKEVLQDVLLQAGLLRLIQIYQSWSLNKVRTIFRYLKWFILLCIQETSSLAAKSLCSGKGMKHHNLQVGSPLFHPEEHSGADQALIGWSTPEAKDQTLIHGKLLDGQQTNCFRT